MIFFKMNIQFFKCMQFNCKVWPYIVYKPKKNTGATHENVSSTFVKMKKKCKNKIVKRSTNMF